MRGCRGKRREVEEAVGGVAQDEEWRRQGASAGHAASAWLIKSTVCFCTMRGQLGGSFGHLAQHSILSVSLNNTQVWPYILKPACALLSSGFSSSVVTHNKPALLKDAFWRNVTLSPAIWIQFKSFNLVCLKRWMQPVIVAWCAASKPNYCHLNHSELNCDDNWWWKNSRFFYEARSLSERQPWPHCHWLLLSFRRHTRKPYTSTYCTYADEVNAYKHLPGCLLRMPAHARENTHQQEYVHTQTKL